MSTVKELGDLWERQLMADLRKKRKDYKDHAARCVQGGEFGAQILRIAAIYDVMIDAAYAAIDANAKEPT